MEFVCDATFLIAIYVEIGSPNILEKLKSNGFRFYVPKTVYNEVLKKSKLIEDHLNSGVIELVNVEIPEEYEAYLTGLDDGEKEVIAYSLQANKIPILDDDVAYKCWVNLGGNAMRTGRFIVNCVKNWKIIDELQAIRCLLSLRKSSFRIKDSILLNLIESVLDC
jgi:predicted nucleic acid-binding protein